jgi:hypothetical protein
MREKGTLIHCWEDKLYQQLWKSEWSFLRKLQIDLPYNPTIPFLVVYTKESKAAYKR